MKYLYTATIVKRDSGKYEARIPDIPHCVTSGRDEAEAIEMIADAACSMLTVYEDEGMAIPAASAPGSIPAPDGGFVSVLSLDTDQHRMVYDTRTVRKSVSIPAWMDKLAQKQGVSCSKVLQDALRVRLGV